MGAFIDAQTYLPGSLFPDFLVDLKNGYAHKYGDYLIVQKPHFFIGIIWLELLFQWPLALLTLYGILGAKSWLNHLLDLFRFCLLRPGRYIIR